MKGACDPLTQELWLFCSEFFKIDPLKVKNTDTLKFPGLKRALKPYQIFAIFWMSMKERDGSNGGFMADDMGLGKVGIPISTWNDAIELILEQHRLSCCKHSA